VSGTLELSVLPFNRCIGDSPERSKAILMRCNFSTLGSSENSREPREESASVKQVQRFRRFLASGLLDEGRGQMWNVGRMHKSLSPSPSEASQPGGKLRGRACLPFQRARHPVADGKQRESDPLVGLELGVERADRRRVLVGLGEVGDRAPHSTLSSGSGRPRAPARGNARSRSRRQRGAASTPLMGNGRGAGAHPSRRGPSGRSSG